MLFCEMRIDVREANRLVSTKTAHQIGKSCGRWLHCASSLSATFITFWFTWTRSSQRRIVSCVVRSRTVATLSNTYHLCELPKCLELTAIDLLGAKHSNRRL